MREKKGKNFKEVIEEQKRKGGIREAFMRLITGIDTSILYSFSFLLVFVPLDVLIYWFLVPDVLFWALSLIGSAAVGSILASRVTKIVKKQQWRYAKR